LPGDAGFQDIWAQHTLSRACSGGCL
jgi:hypothetical protein